MLNGVYINGQNTKSAFGFVVLGDIKVGAPPLRRKTVTVPGADGVIDFSYIYGRPIFDTREITFNLFAKLDEETFETRRKAMFLAYHGQRVKLRLPNDDEVSGIAGDDGCYYEGVLEFGDTGAYGGNVIPVRMYADPYKYKTSVNRHGTLTGEAAVTISVEVTSEVPALVTIINSQYCMIGYDGYFTGAWENVQLAAGTHDTQELYLMGLCLQPGTTEFQLFTPVAYSGSCIYSIKVAERIL